MIDFLVELTIDMTNGEFIATFVGSVIACIVSLYLLIRFIRHGRVMQDTPTQKIRSASQGFAELSGHAKALDKPLRAPGSGKPCVWYQYSVEEKRGKDWRTIESDTSIFSFYIDDGTGICAVDPELGEVKPVKRRNWRKGSYRYSEAIIQELDPLYCLGEFETVHGPSKAQTIKIGARTLLNQWKQDRAALLSRFDADGDGDIDMDEWAKARDTARMQVTREVEATYQPTQHHSLVKPFNRSQPYLISAIPEEELTRRYWFHSIAAFAGFLLTGAWAVFMTVVRPSVFPF